MLCLLALGAGLAFAPSASAQNLTIDTPVVVAPPRAAAAAEPEGDEGRVHFRTNTMDPMAVFVEGAGHCLLPCSLSLPANTYRMRFRSLTGESFTSSLFVSPSQNVVFATGANQLRRDGGITLTVFGASFEVIMISMAGLAGAMSYYGASFFLAVGLPFLIAGIPLLISGIYLLATPGGSAQTFRLGPGHTEARRRLPPSLFGGWLADAPTGAALPALGLRF